MQKLLLDIKDQKILFEKEATDSIIIDHKGFLISLPKSVLDTLEVKKCYLSPFTLLALREDKKSLSVAILEKYIYIAIFDAKKPLLVKIFPLEEKSLAEIIEELLHEFYQQEGAFFVEKIVIYLFNENYTLEKERLQEQFFVDVEVISKPLGELLNKDIEAFCIKKEEKRLLKQYRYPLLIGVGLFLVLFLYDLFLRYQLHTLQQQTTKLIERQTETANKNNELQSKLIAYQRIEPMINKILSQNTLLLSQIKEILELIPDHTFLTYFEYRKEKVILEGMTKDIREVRTLYQTLLKSFKSGKMKFQKKRKYLFFHISLEKVADDEE